MYLIPIGAGNFLIAYRIYEKNHKDAGGISTRVLKLPRVRIDAESFRLKMKYREDLSEVLQEYLPLSSDFHIPMHNMCLISREVADNLRNHAAVLIRENSFGGRFLNKRINYTVELESKSMEIDENSIILLSEFTGTYDSNAYEPCFLEEDLFHKNALNSSESFKQVALELKLKCGLLNFRNVPSLFQLVQKRKLKTTVRRRQKTMGGPDKSQCISQCEVHHLNSPRLQGISEGGVDVQLPLPSGTNDLVQGTNVRSMRLEDNVSQSQYFEASLYNPCNMFKMTFEGVRDELLNLCRVPQNNIRLFIDSYEVDPLKLEEDQCLLNMMIYIIINSKGFFEKLLKYQALAAGHQFIGSILDQALNLSNLVAFRRERSLNLMDEMERAGLDRLFKTVHPYRLQHHFHNYSKSLLVGLLTNTNALLTHYKMFSQCNFSAGHLNLSMYRIFRSNSSNSILSSLPTQVYNRDVLNAPVDLILYTKAEFLIRNIIKTFYPLNTNCTHEYIHQIVDNLKLIQEMVEGWTLIYITGRVTMDLSIIINIALEDEPAHRTSIIDLDLKGKQKIKKWKDDLMDLPYSTGSLLSMRPEITE